MTLKVIKSGSLGGSHNFGIQFSAFGHKGDIHQRTILLYNSPLKHLAVIQEVIQRLRFFHIDLIHRFQTAQALQILEDLTANIDRPAIGGVVHGGIICMDVVTHVSWYSIWQVGADQIFADDHDRQTSRTHVFLHAAVDQTVIADIHWFGEEHRALVGHQCFSLGIGEFLISSTVDGLVFANVNIIGIFRYWQIRDIRNVTVVLIFAGSNQINFSELLGFGIGFIGPIAGHDVICDAILHQVHRDHGKLQCGTTLDKQDFVIVRDIH